MSPDTLFNRNALRIIQVKFGSNLSTDIRGEDFFKKITDDDDGHQMMASLWVL
jgi:hypothetical protein